MTMSQYISIRERFVIVPKNVGRYHSFPAMVRFKNSLLLSFRSGFVQQGEMHGTGGAVHLLHADVSCPQEWRPLPMGMDTADDDHNEMDAILSLPSEGGEINELFLATRNYDVDGICRTWLSKLEGDFLIAPSAEPHLNLIPRRHLKEISDLEINCYGHIQRTLSGELLMPGYTSSPVLLFSGDNGLTWQFRSQIYENDDRMTLSEFSMVHQKGTEWMALIRNEKRTQALQLICSEDDGQTWSHPEPTVLTGHAPMAIRTWQGDFMVIYRDLSEKKQGVSIGFCRGDGRCWEMLGRLCEYTGNLYDGGYGDLLQLKQNLFLAVYYRCDKDASPWIEGVLFSR